MKRIIYVLLMMLPVMASAQTKNEEDARKEELHNALVKTFKDVAKRTSVGGYYTIYRKIEWYSVGNISLKKNWIVIDGKNCQIPVSKSDSIKQMEKTAYIVNEFWNVYDKFYRYVPKSYNMVQRSMDSHGYDTIRAVLGITPWADTLMNDVERTFREHFLLDYKKGGKKEPYFNSVSVEYQAAKTADFTVEYATLDDLKELKGMVSDYIKTLKGYKMKAYNVSYEYSDDYKKTEDAMPTLNYIDGPFGGIKTTGKHYVIQMPKEEILSNCSVFNKLIEKAKVLGAMRLQTSIDLATTIGKPGLDPDLLVTHTYIKDEKTQTSLCYNVYFGFDEKGLHILEAECNNFNNPIPMMWMNIKTLYNDKVKWEKGLEP